MFIAPKEDESQEEFLARVTEATKLLGGESLYSLLKKRPPQDDEDDADS